MTSYLNMDYVSKMKYNRDKDVVFVYKPDSIWNEKEYVHEIHHLEQTVPFAISAIEDRSLYNRDDGILTVYDMNEHNELKFYNEDKYWNMELKEDFLNSTNGMWINGFNDKRSGSIFSYHAKANEESTLMQMKVGIEMEEAIKKHGKVTQLPKEFKDEFHEKIDAARARVAARSATSA
jgi:hypothetical protein